jgi:hypothetical protein
VSIDLDVMIVMRKAGLVRRKRNGWGGLLEPWRGITVSQLLFERTL